MPKSQIMQYLDVLFLLGRPLAPLYSAVMTLRSTLYRNGILASARLPVPVVSVGNLTMGGTGKTPTVALLAEILRQKGFRPAVVSRGYGGTAAEPVNVVSDGEKIFLSVAAAGDEPYMLAANLKGIPVVTGKKRAVACKYVVERFGSDILVLDDGFQHLAVRRDLDIVLFNATTLAGNSRVFPGGELREPIKALNRADAFVLTGICAENRERAASFKQLLERRFPKTPVFLQEMAARSIQLAGGERIAIEEVVRPLYAFSGIAHPERFLTSLSGLGLRCIGHSIYKDHAVYRGEELTRLARVAGEHGADALITTQKDMVKLENIKLDMPVYALEIEARPAPEFLRFFDSRLPAAPTN